MRPIMTSPCSVCGVTLTHDHDPRTVLCAGCVRDRFGDYSLFEIPPTVELRKSANSYNWAMFCVVSLSFASGFVVAAMVMTLRGGGMKARKARRVRICQCPHCGQFVPVSPKLKGEAYGLTVCEACFMVIDNRQVHSWLEDREAIPA